MKKIIALLMMLTLIFSMTACGNTNDEGNSTTDSGKETSTENESTSNDDEKIEIRLLTRMAGTTTQVQIFKDVLKEFEAKHPDVVIVDESQGDESSFNNKLKTDIASGTLPNIFRIQGVANLSDYIENGMIMDMGPVYEANPEWSEGLAKGAMDYYKVPGYEGYYGVPMESGLIGVFYNEKVLNNAGIDKFPETWNELKEAIVTLNEADVVPIALGAKSTYMAGHLHNQIFYKWLGIDAAKALGTREKKWTDADVVETLTYVKELYDMDAFPEGTAGISDDIAVTQFLKGDAAMIITGPWNIGKFTNPEETEFADSIHSAKFPYFEEKPEFKDHDMQIISPYMVSGDLEGKEKEYTTELVMMLTSADAAKRYAEEAQFLMPRNDIDIADNTVSDLFKEVAELGGTSQGIAVDVFDFDPVGSMQDRTRNSIVGMFVGNTPEQAAQEIQSEIDNK